MSNVGSADRQGWSSYSSPGPATLAAAHGSLGVIAGDSYAEGGSGAVHHLDGSRLAFGPDGRSLQLALGSDPSYLNTAFTLLIYLAGSFPQSATRIQHANGGRDVVVDYPNGVQLAVNWYNKKVGDKDDDADDGLDYYRLRWSKEGAAVGTFDILKDAIILYGNSASNKNDTTSEDDTVHWYGGSFLNKHRWPMAARAFPSQSSLASGNQDNDGERIGEYEMRPFVTEDVLQLGVSGQDRYWLSSRKIALWVPEQVPLWTSIKDGALILQSLAQAPYTGQVDYLEYELAVPQPHKMGISLREFHMLCFRRYLKFPKVAPDIAVIDAPIYTSWAYYWTEINESAIMEYVGQMHAHGFSISQFELDDKWTTEYGDFVIDPKRFPDMPGMIERMKALGVPRLTAWVHPFINVESKNGQNLALRRFFLRDLHGVVRPTTWWQGKGYVLDMTNPDARQWFRSQLQSLQQQGIYTYKFDAGETTFLPVNFSLYSGETNPNAYGHAYAQFCDQFGTAVENRFGAGTQEAAIWTRTMDRDSYWDKMGGMNTVIPWMLSFSLHGYFWNLPDMIGGNARSPTGTRAGPEKELFIRWTQLNTFLLALQFSYAPWHYDAETMAIARAMLTLRNKWLPYIHECVAQAVKDGQPPLRPMWWESDAPEALASSDQFMVGTRLLVAPVTVEGTRKRSVYLPAGEWKDGNTGTMRQGPIWIDVQAPLGVLPHFERISSDTAIEK